MGLQSTKLEVWQGQFPPPEALERYEALLPGAFNRLLTMAETAQSAGVDSNKLPNAYLHVDIRRGHWLGAAVAVLAGVGALVALRMGSAAVAIVFLSVPVMAVVKTLLETGRKHPQRMDLSQDQK